MPLDAALFLPFHDRVRGQLRADIADDERNGYRDRIWTTRTITVELRIPKLRKGCYLPGFLEPPLILPVEIRRAFFRHGREGANCGNPGGLCPGVSTQSVDDLVEALVTAVRLDRVVAPL